MAKLINGNGNLAIYAEEDADWFGSIFGNTTAITGIGNQFAYSLLDANTVGVQDGVIISKEGRRVQLNANEIDEFDIPTGAQGTTSYYIIGYHLITDETSAQTCETFVELMDNGTDTIPEGTFRGGDDDIYISLYRVKQVDLAITQLTLLLPKVSTISEINQHLTALESEVAKMGMPLLNYSSPLYVFSNTNKTYTTTKECYLYGMLASDGNITIGGTNVEIMTLTGSPNRYAVTSPLRIPSGVTISVSGTVANTTTLAVFEEVN